MSALLFITAFLGIALSPDTLATKDIAYAEYVSATDPANPVDTGLEPSSRWYLFTLTGTGDREVFVKIHGSEVRRPFYTTDGKNYRRFENGDCTGDGYIHSRFPADTVTIAYFLPYTHDNLRESIAAWTESGYAVADTIGYSFQGRPLAMLTVTDPSTGTEGKKTVYIHSRVHTSEAPASWHLDALMNRLCSPDDSTAAALRREAVFYVIPFANPDGVALGLSRSNAQGINMEINWDRPDSLTAPEVKVLRTNLENIIGRHGGLDVFLNMHSQIADNVTYWVHTAESTSEEFFEEEMRFARLTAGDGNPYFSFEDISYSDLGSRYAEGWIWKNCGAGTMALTFETPYTFYGDPDGEWVSRENLDSLAGHSLRAICDFLYIPSGGSVPVAVPDRRGARIRADIPDGTYRTDIFRRDGKESWEPYGEITVRNGVLRTRINGKKYSSIRIHTR